MIDPTAAIVSASAAEAKSLRRIQNFAHTYFDNALISTGQRDAAFGQEDAMLSFVSIQKRHG